MTSTSGRRPVARVWAVSFLIGATLAVGCGDDEHSVSIDIRTDFLPADEFDVVRLTIDSSDERTVADAAANYLDGVRVYDGNLSAGDHEVVVTLERRGEGVVSRRVLFRVDTDRGMTVLLTRSCASVMCGAASTCASGMCVDPGCTPETPERCDVPECGTDTECRVGMCGVAACVLGACFQIDDGACGDRGFCVPSLGCQPRDRSDAGPGLDASVDASGDVTVVDGGRLDAGPDGSPQDTEPFDAGRDVPGPGDTGGPDVPMDAGPMGACINDADEAAFRMYSVQRGINDGYTCYGIHGNNPMAIRSCVQAEVSVTNACAQCIVEIVECTIDNCAADCGNPAAMICTTCRAANCNEPFRLCSGHRI